MFLQHGQLGAPEELPSRRPWGGVVTKGFLAGGGMPIGEVWDLGVLSAKCKEIVGVLFDECAVACNICPANVLALL